MELDRLIQVMPEVVSCCPDACLVVGGTSPEEAHLRHLIETRTLDDYARLAGCIPPDCLAEAVVGYLQRTGRQALTTQILHRYVLHSHN